MGSNIQPNTGDSKLLRGRLWCPRIRPQHECLADRPTANGPMSEGNRAHPWGPSSELQPEMPGVAQTRSVLSSKRHLFHVDVSLGDGRVYPCSDGTPSSASNMRQNPQLWHGSRPMGHMCGGPQLVPEGNFPPSWGHVPCWEGLLNLSALPGSPFLRTPETCRRSPKHPTAPCVVRVPHTACDMLLRACDGRRGNATFCVMLSSFMSWFANALIRPQEPGYRIAVDKVQLY